MATVTKNEVITRTELAKSQGLALEQPVIRVEDVHKY